MTGSSGGRDDNVMNGNGGRRSLRATRGVDYHESEEEKEGDEENEDEDSYEEEQEHDQEEDGEKDDHYEQEIHLFSDDEPENTKRPNTRTLGKKSHQSDDQEFPSFLSPTALLNGLVPSSDDEPEDEPEDEPDERDETSKTYANNTGQYESSDSDAEQLNAEELDEVETNRPSESRKWRLPPTPAVEIRFPPSSPHNRRSSPAEQEMRNHAEGKSFGSEPEEEHPVDKTVNGEQLSSMSLLHRPEISQAEQEMHEDYIEREVERESDDSESGESAPHHALNGGEKLSRTSIPHRPQGSPEQEMHSGHTAGKSERESDNSEEEQSTHSEAQRAGKARLRRLLAELETRKYRTLRESDGSKLEEEQLPDDMVNDNGGSVSSLEPEDEQNSSSSSPEPSEVDEEDFPQRQPRKRRRVERYSPGFTRRQSNRNTKFVTGKSENSENEIEGNEESHHEEYEAERAAAIAEEEQARKLQWMGEAMRLGGQQVNWLILTRTAKELKQLVDPSLAESFVDMLTTIRVLSRLYGERDHQPSEMTLKQCNNLFGSIRCEGERLLDQAYHLATTSNGTHDEVYACDLVDEFEARVFPEMVKLVFACFKVYYTDMDMFPGIHDHFRRALVLLRQLCDRTTSMKMQRIVHGTVRCKEPGRALKAIIKALDSCELRRRKSERFNSSISDRSGQDESCGSLVIQDDADREWSQDEGLALIDGLRTYQGMLSLCHMAHKSTDTTRA